LKGYLPKDIKRIKEILHDVCFDLAKRHCDNETNLNLKDGSLYVLLPGLEQQDRHVDYDLDHPNAAKSLIILSYFSDNGKFIFYNDNTEYILDCAKGDIIICRGDIEHAGASYSELNLRDHFYGDYVDRTLSKKSMFGQVTRDANVTYAF
jgi:hypothetical protein